MRAFAAPRIAPSHCCLRFISLFHWAGGASPLGKPLDWGGVLVLVATAALLLAATLVLFERRDLRA